MLNEKDLLLLVIAAAKDTSLTPNQLQKATFHIEQQCAHRITRAPGYDFAPHDYGPYAAAIYADADALAAAGLALRIQANEGDWTNTVSTHSGRARAEQLQQELEPEIVQLINDVVEWAQGLSFRELNAAICAAYPAYGAKSVFRQPPTMPAN